MQQTSTSMAYQSSPFFRLSAELRNTIYELSMPQDVTITTMNAYRLPGIVTACKQTYTESIHMYFHNTKFIFTDNWLCFRFLSRLPRTSAKALTAVRLTGALNRHLRFCKNPPGTERYGSSTFRRRHRADQWWHLSCNRRLLSRPIKVLAHDVVQVDLVDLVDLDHPWLTAYNQPSLWRDGEVRPGFKYGWVDAKADEAIKERSVHIRMEDRHRSEV